ncbi:MAG: RimK/LysX family protein [Gammaproteobacteria bacterium]
MMKKFIRYSRYLLTLLWMSAMVSTHAASTEEVRPIFGYVENVTLLPEDLTLAARIDSGATTASLYAVNIEQFEQEDETWVSFEVPAANGTLTAFTRKLVRVSRIKGRIEEGALGQIAPLNERPVIKIQICIGNQIHEIEMNLTNRQNLLYPVLIGRKALIKFAALIDPNVEFKQKLSCNEA